MKTDLILNNVGRHITLDLHEKELFLSLLNWKTIKRKEHVLKQGQIARNEIFIVSGCMRAFTSDNKGNEHVIMFGIEDWWIGDLYSFLTENPATYNIEALEDSEILEISKNQLEELYMRVPKFERFFRLLLQNAFIAQQQRINQSLTYTAEVRYLEFLRKYPGIDQRIPQKQIAAYLGITPVFLSMIRRKLSQQ